MTGPYELGTAPPARRALADRLPLEVVVLDVRHRSTTYRPR